MTQPKRIKDGMTIVEIPAPIPAVWCGGSVHAKCRISPTCGFHGNGLFGAMPTVEIDDATTQPIRIDNRKDT